MNKLLIVCNALDEETKVERSITTDSPAASRKIFMLSETVQSTDTEVVILSLGRGRVNNSFRFFSSKIKKKGNIKIVYLPFLHLRFISELLTFFSLPLFLYMNSYINKGKLSVLFYNREKPYLLGVILAKFLGLKCILDLEDGETKMPSSKIGIFINKNILNLYDNVCRSGALLACSALEQYTSIKKTICYYGVSKSSVDTTGVSNGQCQVLFSGTIELDTGSELLYETILKLRDLKHSKLKYMTINICGKGDGLNRFLEFQEMDGFPKVVCYGSLDFPSYKSLLNSCNIGLSLKRIGGTYANTTFPSKVVEYSSNRLTVISTDISDVKSVLGDDGAFYINENSSEQLSKLLLFVLDNLTLSMNVGNTGYNNVLDKLDANKVRKEITDFIFC